MSNKNSSSHRYISVFVLAMMNVACVMSLRGLPMMAKEGELPPFLQYTNKNNIQTHILWVQGAIVTVISLAYLLMPTISAAFFLLTSLTAILYLIIPEYVLATEFHSPRTYTPHYVIVRGYT